MIDGQKRSFLKFQDVRAFLDSVLDSDIHAKRVDSLANATLGVMTGASLGVAIIDQSLAQARGLVTEYAADGQATLALNLVTRHGRATPLVWLSVFKDELKDARNAYEDAALRRLAEVL